VNKNRSKVEINNDFKARIEYQMSPTIAKQMKTIQMRIRAHFLEWPPFAPVSGGGVVDETSAGFILTVVVILVGSWLLSTGVLLVDVSGLGLGLGLRLGSSALCCRVTSSSLVDP
jgi:hypothetical protein